MASGNYRADHVGGLLPLPGSAGEFADDPVAGAIDAQLKAVMDVFTDGASVAHPDNAVAAAEALRERAPSWAKLKVSLPAVSEPVIACAHELFAAGVTYVQFDGTGYATKGELSEDHELLSRIEVPEGCTTALYLGPAGAITLTAESIFGLPVGRFLIALESGELELLRSMAEDRFAVLGLVDAASTELQEPDPLLKLIDKAAAIHGDKLAICPTQSFNSASTAVAQQQRLELVSDVARMFWGTEL